MQFVTVLTALLALAAAARIPVQKPENANQMIQDYESDNYDDTQEQVERDSIAGSFDAIANVINQYKDGPSQGNGLDNMKNEIFVPDTVNVGSDSDTILTNIRVKGLRKFNSQSLTMSWGQDLVNAEISWGKLTVNGVYHYINSVARYSGVFEIVLVEPEYSGNTSLTKNANVYPMMYPANSITFRKATINHAKLPEIFQNDKPQFEYLIKNVVCQYIATAVGNGMYNDIVMDIRKTVRPYLTYRSDKIANGATAFNGQLANGNRFEMQNVRFDNSKNGLAKISLVQMNNTGGQSVAEFALRLLNFTGQFDLTATFADGNGYNGKVAYEFGRVNIIPIMNLNDRTVRTRVLINAPKIVFQSQESGSTARENAQQLIKPFIELFSQKLAEATSQNIQAVM